MKRSEDDEPTRFRDDSEFFTPRDIRTVDLARVAARLLGPRDDDYANAALRALRLMHVCASVLNRNRNRRDAATRAKAKLAAVGATGLYSRTPFFPGIKAITGEKRRDRAEAAFLSYLEATMPDATKAELAAEYADAEQHGFTGQELFVMQSKFNALRESGRLAGKKRGRRSARSGK